MYLTSKLELYWEGPPGLIQFEQVFSLLVGPSVNLNCLEASRSIKDEAVYPVIFDLLIWPKQIFPNSFAPGSWTDSGEAHSALRFSPNTSTPLFGKYKGTIDVGTFGQKIICILS